MGSVRVVTFKLDEDIIRKLDDIARIEGVPRSVIIRRAIELYLKMREPPRIPYKVIRLWS